MKNRNLEIKDKLGNFISEEDELEIAVKSLEGTSFFNGNLGNKCRKTNTDKIIVKLKNCYPYIKVDYSIQFLPSGEMFSLNDVFFLKYISGYCENKTKKICESVNLNSRVELDIQDRSGKNIVSNDTIIVPKKDINPKIFKEEFYNYLVSLQYFESLGIEISNDGFHVKVKYWFLKQDGSLLNNKEVHNLQDNSDDSIQAEPYYNYCFPFKNHAESFLKDLFS